MNGKLQAVAFDIDGTLYHNSTMYWRSLPFALGNLRLLSTLKKVREGLRDHHQEEPFLDLQDRMVAAETGWSLEKTRELIRSRIYGQWESSLKDIALVPGLLDTLSFCKDRGLKLGLLSDFPVNNKIGLLGLEGWWDFSICSEDTGFLKPHPEPFSALAAGLACNPGSILYVGDSFHCDVLGAKASGFQVAHFTRRPKKNSPADLSFSKHGQLRAYIEQKA